MPITPSAVDTYISARVTAVTQCGATDVAPEFPEAQDWLSNLGLRVIFNNAPPPHLRHFVIQLCRKTEGALESYARACQLLSGFVGGGSTSWSTYFGALSHFELAIGQLYQAYDIGRKRLQFRLFASSDETPIARLNELYNASKHDAAADEQPLWIDNAGLCCEKYRLEFPELEELLRSMARIVTKILAGTPPSRGNGGT